MKGFHIRSESVILFGDRREVTERKSRCASSDQR
jgi:hypothetical protein